MIFTAFNCENGTVFLSIFTHKNRIAEIQKIFLHFQDSFIFMKLALALLFCVLPAFAKEAISPQDRVKTVAEQNHVETRMDQPYANNDNPKQKLDLYLPLKRSNDKPLPVIALIHGGGWVNGDRIGYGGLGIQLAKTGNYAAVGIGYRLTAEAPWPAQIHDCKAAIRWIRAHAKELNLDPDKIVVWGSSAGGHLSSLLGTSGDVKELEGDLGSYKDVSSRVQAVVNLCGPEDFSQALVFNSRGEADWDDKAVIGLFGGNAKEKKELALQASPVTYVSKDDPPFITFHGTADKRVHFKHAELIHKSLQAAGVVSLLVPITDGGHGSVGHPEVSIRGEKFVAKILRDIQQEIDTTPIQALPEKKK